MSLLAVQGGATGTGTVTLLAPITNTNRTLTLPDNSGTVLTSASNLVGVAGVGKVLQVVSAEKSDVFSSASTSFVDITGLSVSITPSSATSKILVFMAVQAATGGIEAPMIRLVRDSTAIAIGDARGSRIRTTVQGLFIANNVSSLHGITLDSPSTTSLTTYKLQMRSQSGTAFVNTQSATEDGSFHGTQYSSIVVMEIAA